MTGTGQTPSSQDKLEKLRQLALALGCDGAVIHQTGNIRVDPALAALCKETRCPNYGISPTCPPHVKGPDWFQDYSRQTPHALFLKIEMDESQMYSEQRDEIAKLLHFIVIEVEREACRGGFSLVQGFAGGSCKAIFCPEHYTCELLEGSGGCRNPDSARPSVSGFGIDTNHLLKISGWSRPTQKTGQGRTQSSRYGLILLG